MSTLPRPNPISLSDEQLSMVINAAALLPPSDRDQFLRALADVLRNEPELGDGILARSIRSVIRPLFRPPTLADQPRHNSRVGEPIP
jgi:hypothetical protein